MSLEFEGDLNLSELRDKLNGALPDALRAGGDVIGELADEKVPVLVDLPRANDERRAFPGELKASRYVRVEGNSDVAIGYEAYWAAWQHEKPYHHEIGQQKYLENALNEGQDAAMQAVADKIREGLSG